MSLSNSLLPQEGVRGGSRRLAVASGILAPITIFVAIPLAVGFWAIASTFVGGLSAAIHEIPFVAQALGRAIENDASSTPLLATLMPERVTWFDFVILGLFASSPFLLGWWTYRQLASEKHCLTPTHLFIERGGIRRKTWILPLHEITGVQVARARFLSFGMTTVTISTRSLPVHLFNVKEPERFVQLIHALAPEPVRTPAAPLPTLEWQGRLSGRGLAAAVASQAIIPGVILAAPEVLTRFGATVRFGISDLILAVLFIIVGAVKVAGLVRHEYAIVGGCVRVRRGLLSTSEHRMDIARIGDVQLVRPLISRIFHSANLRLISDSGEKLTLYGFADPEELRGLIERARTARGVPA